MTHTFQPPDQIHGSVDRDGSPTYFTWQGQRHKVVTKVESWEIHTNWWESTGVIRRVYHAIITDAGLFCVLYCDLLTNTWYMAKVYD